VDTEILNSFRADLLDLSRWFVSDGFMNEFNEAAYHPAAEAPRIVANGPDGPEVTQRMIAYQRGEARQVPICFGQIR
jgi:hypothetical protein